MCKWTINITYDLWLRFCHMSCLFRRKLILRYRHADDDLHLNRFHTVGNKKMKTSLHSSTNKLNFRQPKPCRKPSNIVFLKISPSMAVQPHSNLARFNMLNHLSMLESRRNPTTATTGENTDRNKWREVRILVAITSALSPTVPPRRRLSAIWRGT